ncbi:MAG: hypothetical protein JXB49_16580 [Bacteroidales bacterium]|nr:hypothetical protein [Bacteroidales bacterium]
MYLQQYYSSYCFAFSSGGSSADYVVFGSAIRAIYKELCIYNNIIVVIVLLSHLAATQPTMSSSVPPSGRYERTLLAIQNNNYLNYIPALLAAAQPTMSSSVPPSGLYAI